MSKNIAIIGAGIAGLFSALGFAKNGHRVTIFSKAKSDKRKPGELLSPEIQLPLSHYGLWRGFESHFQIRSSGTSSVWEEETPYHQDAIIKPHGGSYIVSRQEFECFLTAAAIEKGIDFVQDPKNLSASKTSNGFEVSYQNDCKHYASEFDYLVEATGRSRGVIGCGERKSYDNLVAVIGYLDVDKKFPRNMFLEAVEHGWIYTTLVSRNRAVLAFMTDADLLPLGKRAKKQFYIDSITTTIEVYPIVKAYLNEVDLKLHSACSSKREEIVGNNWAAVGDAALSFDPICGKGMLMAAMSGHALSNTLKDSCNFNEAIEAYQLAVHETFKSYLNTKEKIYAGVSTRYGSTFWKRRSHPK